MEEKHIVLFSCIFLATLSFIIVYGFQIFQDFNFYKSELMIEGRNIQEKLTYSPDKPYRTLYRNFVDAVYLSEEENEWKNSVIVHEVSCSAGTPYLYSASGNFYTFSSGKPEKVFPPIKNTEPNEYGCTFGEVYGFSKGKDYIINAKYFLNNENIFQIGNKYYIKFVVYSKGKHKDLIVGKNFFISGEAVYKRKYSRNENVIIYIPLEEGNYYKNIFYLKNFEYDSSRERIFIFLIGLLPAITFFLAWYFFGKETIEVDYPSSLSYPPNSRKPWEVAAYFNPPFNVMDKNFISAMILDLYKRKIIDIKVEKKFLGEDCYIKILKKEDSLDPIEKEFLEIISWAKERYKEKYSNEGYVNLNKISWIDKNELSLKFYTLGKKIKNNGKKYLSSIGSWIFFFSTLATIYFFLYFYPEERLYIIPLVSLFLGSILEAKSSLFVRYKEEYFKEYKHWQAFKNYLNGAPSLKLHGHKGVVLWGEYLTYACALGISERVIKELKENGLITEEQYHTFIATYSFSASLAHTSGMRGAHGGAGAGGVGGGGGGGR